MSSATKRLEQCITQLEPIQEYPLSAFSDIRRIHIPKTQSQSGVEEVRVSAIWPGRVAVMATGIPNKSISKALITLLVDDLTIDTSVEARGTWHVLIDREFLVGETADGLPIWVPHDKKYKKAPAQATQVKLRRLIQEVAQRYFNRVSTVDKF